MFGAGNRKRQTVGEQVAAIRARAVAIVRAWWRRTLVAAAIVAAFAAGIWAWRTLCETEHFLLRRLEVAGTRAMTDDEVAAACGVRTGRTNLLFTSAASVAAACEADPRIRRTAVDIEPPDRMAVRVEEQQAALYAATPSGLWAVNPYGEAYAPAHLDDLADLPLLVPAGTEPEPGAPPAILAPAVLRDALALVRTVGVAGSPWEDTSLLLAYDPDLGFELSAAGRGLKARFGRAPFPMKFERLVEALDVATKQRLVVEQVWVDNEARPNSVTLRLALSGNVACGDE